MNGYKLFLTPHDVRTGGDERAAHAELPIPCDLRAVIEWAEEYDGTADGRSKGFIFHLKTDGNEQYNGMHFRWYAPETEKAKFKMLQMLDACGMIPHPVPEGGLQMNITTDMFGKNEITVMMRADYPHYWYWCKERRKSYTGLRSPLTGEPYIEAVSLWNPASPAPPMPEWAEGGAA